MKRLPQPDYKHVSQFASNTHSCTPIFSPCQLQHVARQCLGMAVAGPAQAQLHSEPHGLQLYADVTLVGERGRGHAEHVRRALRQQLLRRTASTNDSLDGMFRLV